MEGGVKRVVEAEGESREVGSAIATWREGGREWGGGSKRQEYQSKGGRRGQAAPFRVGQAYLATAR